MDADTANMAAKCIACLCDEGYELYQWDADTQEVNPLVYHYYGGDPKEDRPYRMVWTDFKVPFNDLGHYEMYMDERGDDDITDRTLDEVITYSAQLVLRYDATWMPYSELKADTPSGHYVTPVRSYEYCQVDDTAARLKNAVSRLISSDCITAVGILSTIEQLSEPHKEYFGQCCWYKPMDVLYKTELHNGDVKSFMERIDMRHFSLADPMYSVGEDDMIRSFDLRTVERHLEICKPEIVAGLCQACSDDDELVENVLTDNGKEQSEIWDILKKLKKE